MQLARGVQGYSIVESLVSLCLISLLILGTLKLQSSESYIARESDPKKFLPKLPAQSCSLQTLPERAALYTCTFHASPITLLGD